MTALTKGSNVSIQDFPLPEEAQGNPTIAAIWASRTFDDAYYLAHYPDVAASGTNPLTHYVLHGYKEGRNPSAMFDSAYYLTENPDVATCGMNPLLHFCESGWKELRKPCKAFDVWWYWSTHLNPADDSINPLADYLERGQQLDLSTRPRGSFSQDLESGHSFEGTRAKRICLFAGYDPEGLIDDYVIRYVTELSRHADVYYLADCVMTPAELAKLKGIAKGAWAGRHGGYDFGSYSLLAKSLIGWETIQQYDELLLVNDSCYLLKGLDDVFAEMDARKCDWWGLQATKGIAKTREDPSNKYTDPINIKTVRSSMMNAFESIDTYDFLIGSYFVAYRKPVLEDSTFQNFLNSVTREPNKQNIVLKYEIGFTRYLICKHYTFDTYISYLYPFHPIYSNRHFTLIKEGFPLLKRYLLSANHYRTPKLYLWKKNILEILPKADLETIEHNLKRIVPTETLQKNLYIGTPLIQEDSNPPHTLLDYREFIEADYASPKYYDWWAFPVCGYTGIFSGNERAVFEAVRHDSTIRKIILTRHKPVALSGENIIVVPLESPEGQYYLMRAKFAFIRHTPARNIKYPISSELHYIVNLWHGIPLKRIGCASLDQQHKTSAIIEQHRQCKAVISSSSIDRLAMTAAFYPLRYNDVWQTGLPRVDFILRDFSELPDDLKADSAKLVRELQGRTLILFMPTFRNEGVHSYYNFTKAELAKFGEVLIANNAVLGIREHMADETGSYLCQLQGVPAIDLNVDDYPHPEILYRDAAVLITDYSSCFFDFMLTNKPMISFAYDLDYYSQVERGFFYQIEDIFPGPICIEFGELLKNLQIAIGPDRRPLDPDHERKKRMFFDYTDDKNAARVVMRAKELNH